MKKKKIIYKNQRENGALFFFFFFDLEKMVLGIGHTGHLKACR